MYYVLLFGQAICTFKVEGANGLAKECLRACELTQDFALIYGVYIYQMLHQFLCQNQPDCMLMNEVLNPNLPIACT